MSHTQMGFTPQCLVDAPCNNSMMEDKGTESTLGQNNNREELQEALCSYTSDTLSYLDTVRSFCSRLSKWILWRETESDMMMDIKDRADKIDLSLSHVNKSENKGEAFWEYMKRKFTSADSRRAELEKELAAVVTDTLEGLEKLDDFLDAVERLAVTSLHVVTEMNQVVKLPQEISIQHLQDVITAARLVCPLLLQFKRDAKVFFQPSLHNVEVLNYQLDKYIQITQIICEKMEMEMSSVTHSSSQKIPSTEVELNEDLSEEDIQTMLCHINQLVKIRMDEHFRLVFLFQEVSCTGFIKEFSERQLTMQQFMKEVEENAVQLDNMKKGAKISSVAGSSVGAVGGVLSIIGLALIPVTAGVSLALTLTGVGMGITSGVNSLVTTATEIGVNIKHQKKANEVLQSFMNDVEGLQNCLEEVSHQTVPKVEVSKSAVALAVGKVVSTAGAIGKGLDSIVDTASAARMLKTEEVIAGATKVAVQEGKALRNVPRVASEIPDVGQAIAKGPLALTKSARAGLIALNALFIGMDIFFICKDSISLAKGCGSEVSQFLRARAALWHSEMDSWQKIHDSLCEGLLTSEKNQIVLEKPFY
ncbi:uncharacterized protein LOC142992501 [Genypterus blacodes]|uniref:uncharacterized protein LOC142992501 n=1 Tax=Genypterus blacodes TaxID=154954 RepID=UPI003F767552